MPLLGPDDLLPFQPQRVTVSGTSGSGKSTLAGRIAAQQNLPYTEIDSLFHGPGWTPRPSFVADVERLVAGSAWVTELQYDQARPLLADRTDLMVWLDVPRRVVMWRVARRTLSRRVRRTRLWSGNREPALRTVLTDPEHILRWAWSTHPRTAARVRDLLVSHPDLPVVRLRTAAEAESWLRGPLAASGTPKT